MLFVCLVVLVVGAQAIPLSYNNEWSGGCQGSVNLHADTDIHGWKATFSFDGPVDKLEIWAGTVISQSGTSFEVENMAWDKDLTAGKDQALDFVLRVPNKCPTGTVTFSGAGTGSGGSSGGNPATSSPGGNPATSSPGGSGNTGSGSSGSGNTGSGTSGSGGSGGGSITPAPGSGGSTSSMRHDYGEAMKLSILFYDAQRSGKLPANNPIPWRGDSAMGDNGDGHDLTGGWYDAGDHVKFGLPMAYSSWVLNYGFLKFRDAYADKGQTQMMCDMVKWPLEYFLKAWVPDQQTLYVQVGDGNVDHGFWGRPENMPGDMWRPAAKVTNGQPGADIAADTCSALASGYLVFKEICGDDSFANKVLEAAKSLYDFAMKNNGCFGGAAPFYVDASDRDEKFTAGAWMYMATKQDKYLNDAKSGHVTGTPWNLSWEDKTMGGTLLLYEATKDNTYKQQIQDYLKSWMPGGSVPYTPCGLAWRDQWGSNRHAANAAFVAVIAADDGINSDEYKKWAMTQMNYILGDNKQHMSFEIGFGSNYPKRPHHRGSSCTNSGCPDGDNPNVLKGAIVGGPDQGDNYNDDRNDYTKNEVACDYNAGFQGAVAGPMMQDFNVEENRAKGSFLSRYRLIAISICVIVVFGVLLGLLIWQATRNTKDETGSCRSSCISEVITHQAVLPQNGTETSTSGPPIILPATIKHLLLKDDLEIVLYNGSHWQLDIKTKFNVHLKSDVHYCVESSDHEKRDIDKSICLEWGRDIRLVVRQMSFEESNPLDCYEVEWIALSCQKQVLENCLNASTAHWYGGYADKHQYWPFEKNKRKLSAYLVNDSYIGEIGGVVERYFISSSGFGIYVDDTVPLYYSLNGPDDGRMCLTAKYDDYPYSNLDDKLPHLKYTVCHASNIKEVHKGMTGLFIDKPRDIPDVTLFRYPIWSTWAEFHKDINQTSVLQFANDILLNNFSHAQIEIDDDWTPAYGDMMFKDKKFPNAREMVRDLNDMGFRVTVWVHPFFNADSRSFQVLGRQGYLITQRDSKIMALTPWWDGSLAGILDVSNPNAVDWYLDQLQNLTLLYNISSFKFDAGETSWLPHVYSAYNMSVTNPSHVYPGLWVDLAMRADSTVRHQEVRAMYRTQRYPVFVRMMDKASDWSHDNGLKSIIPGVLTYGLLGYPFVLPDMIGGNAYEKQPDAELFIRWVQLNTFLPSLQFSIVPWSYNETVVSVVRKFTELHEQISDTLIKYAKNSVITGEPIIRPLWWTAPADEAALTIEDEFLLGDDYLIAPIVEQGARSRDIYFPGGVWIDQTRTGTFKGPTWIYNYTADIDELPYFKFNITNVF